MQTAYKQSQLPIEIHARLHEKALAAAHGYLRFEAQLIGILQELDRAKTYLYFEQPSLFAYATKHLKLSEHVALTLIGIARKSNQVPELKAAIENKKINVSNARRIAPILTSENKAEWLEKAEKLSQNKLEQELAKAFPEKAAPTKIKYKTEELARLEMDVPKQVLEMLKRTQEILSQKNQKHVELAHVLEAVLAEYVEKNDPVKKAERGVKRLHVLRRVPKSDSTTKKFTRTHLSSATKHTLILRDQNQCTYCYKDGSQCANKYWLEVHHLNLVANGGNNDLQNLRTLCSGHHQMMHELRI